MDQGQDHQQVYRIQVQAHLDHNWAEWFDPLTIIHQEDGTTVLEGLITDQSALHGILFKIRNLGLSLVSLDCVEPGASKRLQ